MQSFISKLQRTVSLQSRQNGLTIHRIPLSRNKPVHSPVSCSINTVTLERRIHSSLASKSVWRGLHQAVRQGNGNYAQEIVDQVLQDYYRFNINLPSSPSSSSLASIPTMIGNSQRHPPQDVNNNSNNNEYRHDFTLPLDSRIFSLVLQAWKNSEHASLDSALRAHNLLVQMAALADQDVLCDKPKSEDYLAVLECWYQASFLKKNNGKYVKNNRSNYVVLQHVEELWNQMKERQRRDMMTNNTSTRFVLDENAYEIVLSLLAKDGRGEQAEEVLGEAVVQHQRYENNNFSLSSSVFDDYENNNDDKEYYPSVRLELCHFVLQAYIRSKDAKALERAEIFLQKMRMDSSLPNPDVGSYNLVLESMTNSNRRQNSDAPFSDKVEELIRQMKDDRIQPNLMTYQYGIDCLSRMGEAIRAETLLANLVKDYFLQYDADLKPTITPFQSVLRAYSKARRIPDAAERAESILSNMKELSTYLDTYPTVWSYNVVMKCWSLSRSKNSASRTMALYEELRQSSSSSICNDNEGIDCRQDTNDEETFDITAATNLKPDATSINTTLNVFSINKSAVQTEKILWEFFERHIQEPQMNPCPDRIAFTTTIKAWSKSTNPDAPNRAESLLRKMIELYDDGKNQNFKPDVMTYTSVIQCWVKSKKFEAPEKAECILRHLQSMERDGDDTMSPDTIVWNSAISAWGSAEDGERAEALFLEMLDSSRISSNTIALPSAITLTNVLNAWSKTRSPEASDRALALLAKMEQFYRDGILAVKPNVVHYSVVLDCLAYAKQASAAECAESMLRKMIASNDPNMQPTVISYNSVIKAWAYARDRKSITKITSLLREIIVQSKSNPKMRPNSITFGQVLKFLNESDLPDKANRAKAIENLMEIFMENEPKEWVRKELQECLLTATDDEFHRTHTYPPPNSSLVERNEPNISNDTSCDIDNYTAETCFSQEEIVCKTARGRRANNRFNREVKEKNLFRLPLMGRPEAGQDYEISDSGHHVREALVRVRLVDKNTQRDGKDDNNNNHTFSFVVIDGNDEYSCMLPNDNKNYTDNVKGGQFLKISYYWHHCQPVIINMYDAVSGIEIPK